MPPVVSDLIPCSRRSPRCIDARDYNVELRECCREHVIEIMGHLVEAFKNAGITWWADYGTLLGAFRNPNTTWADYPWLPQEGRSTPGPLPGIVPHDKDGDIGVLWTHWSRYRSIRVWLERKGYSVTLNGSRGSSKVFFSTKNHTNVDVFFWRERKDGTLFRNGYAQVDQFKGREFKKDLMFPLTTIVWEGLTLPAPASPEAFLEMRYGPGWRTPIPANNDGVQR